MDWKKICGKPRKMKAYKLRLYPNKEQEDKLNFALDICRQTYNSLLEELNNQTKINRKEIQHKIVELKQVKPELQEVYAKTLQYKCYRLFSNLSALRMLKNNGKRVGKLRFKGKNWFKTINYNQSGFKLIKTNKRYDLLHLSKIGDIRIYQHKEVLGNIKQITIKKSIDKWYATIITDAQIKTECGEKILGIDLGINNFITDSENDRIENPLNYKKHYSKLREIHKDLSRKKKGSNNRKKAKIRLAKHYEKINNCRDDFLHKISTKYIRECKIICVEDLNIKRMMEQKYYNAKNIADSSWGRFTQFLTYKAESAGCRIVKVDPKNTTKTCSKCGNIQYIPLYKREYICSNCGHQIDRDYNSATNILNKGLERASVEMVSDSFEQLSGKQEAMSLSVR
jgi:putative transposase